MYVSLICELNHGICNFFAIGGMILLISVLVMPNNVM